MANAHTPADTTFSARLLTITGLAPGTIYDVRQKICHPARDLGANPK